MEKVYNNMKHSGMLAVIGGVCAFAIGVIMVISGAMLLVHKKDVLF